MNMIRVAHWEEIEEAEWSSRWPNFQPWELACRGSGMIVLSEDFMNKLQDLRSEIDVAIHITSGCRSLDHNKKVRGKVGSFHICDADPTERGQDGGLAVDVATPDGHYRGDLFALAWERGWSIGWNAKKKFLHLDRRIDVGWRQTSFDY